MAWCAEVNGADHSETCAVPAERLVIERELLAALPSLRAATGRLVTRKVDRLSHVTVRMNRYSVPVRLIGAEVKEFCALGPVAEAFITGAAAAGNTRLGPELPRGRRIHHAQSARQLALGRLPSVPTPPL